MDSQSSKVQTALQLSDLGIPWDPLGPQTVVELALVGLRGPEMQRGVAIVSPRAPNMLERILMFEPRGPSALGIAFLDAPKVL